MNARRPRSLRIALAVAAVLSVTAGWAAAPRGGGAENNRSAYRWTDDKGVVHYGDVVPPEFARNGRAELNRQGVEIARIPAQLSPEEAQRDQQRRDREARSKQHDEFLMTTYTSPRDIEQLRDERVALIDGQVDASRAALDEMRTRLQTLMVRAQIFKPYASLATARRMPDALAEELIRAVRERDSLQKVLAAKQAERIEVRERFNSDLDRYQELAAERRARR
jgi:hypothetical protein